MASTRSFPSPLVLSGALMAISLMVGAVGCETPQERSDKKMQEIQNSEWHYKSGAAYFENKQVTLAIRELTIALDKDSKHTRAHYLLGYIYMGRRNYTGAVQHFKSALELEPAFYDAKNALGATYLAMERWSDAIALFQQLLEEPLYTSPELAHNNLGWALYNKREYTEAISHFKMATFLKPEFCLGYNNLGLAMDATRNTREAMRHYNKAIELCPATYAEPHFNLGRIYQSDGNLKTARAHFERCSNLSPHSHLGDRCREYLHEY